MAVTVVSCQLGGWLSDHRTEDDLPTPKIWKNFDLVVKVAQATLGADRDGAKKRQKSLDETFAEGMPAERKQRSDTGGTHKEQVPRPDHTLDSLPSASSARDAGHALFDAVVDKDAEKSKSENEITYTGAEPIFLDIIWFLLRFVVI